MGEWQPLRRSSQRFQEIDLLRASAIVFMVIFHAVYDLHEFAGAAVDYRAPFWFILGKTSALLFILLSGLSSGLSTSPVRRGLNVLLYGMGVTLVTYLVMKEEYVRFGILHFLGTAMILSPFFRRLSSRLLGVITVLIAFLGFWFKTLTVQTSFLLPLGLMYEGFSSIDYYPLFPYLAVTIIGILIYRHFYAQGTGINWRLPGWVQWLSRNSLGIYLIHQPILLLLLYLSKHL
ncbi:heparan-alpha-glucosaminide N-acetyltransferase [Desulfosporosinus sp. FKA]|uniref:heparan-alpha-glucosaminide N-acetyltransferase n=1 Tax=Desulfosporosinus sp. FKA TaxID=1969834 RepID=UPI000B49765A|nr:heparan-alpha-glucosaminide N-acetyltransferase [Desulfosporosinus sp. FKA]